MKNKVRDITTYMSMNNRKEFFLDTNVLYWYCYPRYSNCISKSRQKDVKLYYEFVDRIVQNGNPIVTSIYNVSELLNVIEKNECDIYQMLHPEVDICVKDLRNIPEERNKLKQIMRIALNNVYQSCNVLGFEMTDDIIKQFVNKLGNHKCDFFDYAILMNNIAEKHINIITDDADFISVDEIEIYTVNEHILHSCH